MRVLRYEVKNTHHGLQFKNYICCQCHLVTRELVLFRSFPLSIFLKSNSFSAQVSLTSNFSAEIERRPRLKEQEIKSLAPRSC